MYLCVYANEWHELNETVQNLCIYALHTDNAMHEHKIVCEVILLTYSILLLFHQLAKIEMLRIDANTI